MARKQKKYHYIYKTTNLVNKKYYIGMHSTHNMSDGYIGSGKKLWYSIKKYGKENFKCEILEMLPDRNYLKKREKELVNESTIKDELCMNLQLGGGGGFINEEHARKCQLAGGVAHKEKMKNDKSYRDKVIDRLSEYSKLNHKEGKVNYVTFFGKKHNENTKKLIGEKNSINQKGEKNSQFGTCWITNGGENKKINKTKLYLYPEWELGRTLN
jgi:transcriptional regulator CtsR